MVIDTSALIAILQNEPESAYFEELIRDSVVSLIAAPTRFETAMIVLSRRGEPGLEILRDFLLKMNIETVPFDARHADLALDAFRRYGKSRHRAGLNLGDCVSYALAKATSEPLLFKGDDFAHTDVKLFKHRPHGPD
ncbi:MAG: type II toxin-antitoxin system VapC family toxin [Xanthobacteraceae bacterium]|nr:type II toxin-antitoxin system VapC family toxin [Xanthobacteraceae bacterium]